MVAAYCRLPDQFDDCKNLGMSSALNLPAVSWLLCAHVANEQLQLSIRSCLHQTFTDFELLVVANGPSADEVARAVHAWADGDVRVRIFTTDVKHLIFSLSLGLHYARAKLIARMDSDDLSRSDRLERQVAFMHYHPEVTVLGSSYEVIDAGGEQIRIVHPPLRDREIRRALLRGNPLCHPSVIFRRDAVLELGGYLGGLHAEDYDLWVRLSNDPSNRFANLPEIGIGYRNMGVSAARRSRRAYASMASTQLRNFLCGHGLSWAFAALLSTVKAFLRSHPDR